MNTKPTEILIEWLDSLDNHIQIDLLAMAAHFHPNNEIHFEKPNKLPSLLKEYLTDASIDKREVVMRVFTMIRLIDYVMSNRDSETAWAETLDRTLDLRYVATSRGMDADFIDEVLKSLPVSKDQWLAVSEDWYRLKEAELSDRKIADWYFL